MYFLVLSIFLYGIEPLLIQSLALRGVIPYSFEISSILYSFICYPLLKSNYFVITNGADGKIRTHNLRITGALPYRWATSALVVALGNAPSELLSNRFTVCPASLTDYATCSKRLKPRTPKV